MWCLQFAPGVDRTVLLRLVTCALDKYGVRPKCLGACAACILAERPDGSDRPDRLEGPEGPDGPLVPFLGWWDSCSDLGRLRHRCFTLAMDHRKCDSTPHLRWLVPLTRLLGFCREGLEEVQSRQAWLEVGMCRLQFALWILQVVPLVKTDPEIVTNRQILFGALALLPHPDGVSVTKAPVEVLMIVLDCFVRSVGVNATTDVPSPSRLVSAQAVFQAVEMVWKGAIGMLVSKIRSWLKAALVSTSMPWKPDYWGVLAYSTLIVLASGEFDSCWEHDMCGLVRHAVLDVGHYSPLLNHALRSWKDGGPDSRCVWDLLDFLHPLHERAEREWSCLRSAWCAAVHIGTSVRSAQEWPSVSVSVVANKRECGSSFF